MVKRTEIPKMCEILHKMKDLADELVELDKDWGTYNTEELRNDIANMLYWAEAERDMKDDAGMRSAKKSKMKKDFVIGDMWDRIDILKDDLGCDNLIEETYKAMPSVQANEILEYIARNYNIEFDEPEYFASAKKSKSFNEMIKEQRKQYKNKKVL